MKDSLVLRLTIYCLDLFIQLLGVKDNPAASAIEEDL